MPLAECRISPDETLYIINLTASEAREVLAITSDSTVTPFQHSVSCIGASICQQSVRDSQALLASMLEAVEEAGLPDNALPAIHISGCPSSCGTQQIGTLGFQGGVKKVDGVVQPAFTLLLNGNALQGSEKFGEPIGTILQAKIPEFVVELGKTAAASGLDFDSWLEKNDEAFRALASGYLV